MSYHFGALLPSRAPNAEIHNSTLLGPLTLGIEVTEPILAAQCGLGNIDPQHLDGNASRAAIEEAIAWPLPPRGACLATIRQDADACGAMAILALRERKHVLSATQLERIGLIANSDRFSRGAWPGCRPLPQGVDEIDEVGLGPQALGAIKAGLSLPDTPIAEAVRRTENWIRAGKAPIPWRCRAENAANKLLTALNDGRVLVRDAIPGRVAIVDGFEPGALVLGYRRAPVVIAVANLRSGTGGPSVRKMTIAQYSSGYVDLEVAARLFSVEEPGWGGSPTIIGSPQGVRCTIPVEYCVDVLCNHCL